jgi:hypothetical protein
MLLLSTVSWWIVGVDGQRLKLVCAKWALHLEPAAVEGLARRGTARRTSQDVWHRWDSTMSGSPRHGNGSPRPDTRWVFTPLGYVCGLNILPVGLLLGKNLHPMGKRVLERSAFTHTR